MELRVRTSRAVGLSFLLSVFICGTVTAQPMTWVDTQLSYDFGFSGGLEINGLTADSRHFDTIANPVVGDQSYSYLSIGGVVHGACDAYFWDPAAWGSWGLNHNFELGYNAERPGTGDPDPSTRTLWMNASLSHVLRVTAPMEAHGSTVSSPIAPWSLAMLESGTWNGSVFTPSSLVLDFLAPFPGVTILPPGDYRVRGELSISHVVTGASSVNNVFTWDLQPGVGVPEPGAFVLTTLGLVGLGFLARRKKNRRA